MATEIDILGSQLLGNQIHQALKQAGIKKISGIGEIHVGDIGEPLTVVEPGRFGGFVIRPDDLMVLYIDLINWKVSGDKIVQLENGEASYLMVGFQSQSLAEEAFLQPEGSTPTTHGDGLYGKTNQAVPCILSGPSWLVFRAPPKPETETGTETETGIEIPYSLAGMLDWSKFTLYVANPESKATFTHIEAPFRLVLTPVHTHTMTRYWIHSWVHSLLPVASGELDPQDPDSVRRVELWHTSLARKWEGRRVQPARWQVGSRVFHGPDAENPEYHVVSRNAAPYVPVLRAIDAYQTLPSQYATPEESEPVGARIPLSDQQCRSIVANCEQWPDTPIQVEQLSLSALGAWMKVNAKWPQAELTEWVHHISMGRDQYVKTVTPGRMLPTGHLAAQIEITERKIEWIELKPVAYLRKRKYLVMLERQRDYTLPSQGSTLDVPGNDKLDEKTAKALPSPFKTIRILEEVTPDLAGESALTENNSNAFWPMVVKPGQQQADFYRFHLEAQDHEGQWCSFSAPLVFVKESVAPETAFEPFNSSIFEAQRQICLDNPNLAFAAQGLKAALETSQIVWQAGGWKSGNDPLTLCPVMQQATVSIPALKQLLGNQPGAGITYYPAYVQGASNPAKLFVQLDSALPAQFPSKLAGGIANPALPVKAVSYEYGALGAKGSLDNLATGTFDPGDFFSGGSKLLGLDLAKILASGGTSSFPKIATRQDGEQIITELSWETSNFSDTGGFIKIPGQTRLTIKATQTSAPSAQAADQAFSVSGTLENFKISFGGILSVQFAKLHFSSGSNQKMQITPEIADFIFEGPLEFLQTLREQIPLDGFCDPPSIQVSAQGIQVGYSLGLPEIAMGMFALQNIRLNSYLELPFEGSGMLMGFQFSQRDQPFTVAVSLIAGGGYLGIKVSPKEIVMLEAALEFGGNLSLNLGVASGGVVVMAGIYFKIAEDPEGNPSTDLSGYVRVAGEVEVLGLISISAQFMMELHYLVESKVVYGRASLVVEVEVLFFSQDVELVVERTFACDSSTFSDVMKDARAPAGSLKPSAYWREYCAAFAEYPLG